MDNVRSQCNRNTSETDLPWYKDGLRFECQQCGNCCRGEPGVVWVNKREIEEISSSLNITKETFARNYLRNIQGRFSLLEYANGDCIMYENGCKIYSVRPCQCRTFPFWTTNLKNRSEWEKLKTNCPGVDKGRLHSLKNIRKNLRLYMNRFV